MVKGEAVMAVAIKPLRRRRRTAQRGKPMSQSQRWGKVVITMPVPEGNITTSEILVPVVEEVVEVSTTEEAEDDLPELS
jgi:hypothetical protein